MHFDHILSEYNFFKLLERQLIESEADKISKKGEKGGVIFAIGHGWIHFEYEIIRCFEEAFISLYAVEYLL